MASAITTHSSCRYSSLLTLELNRWLMTLVLSCCVQHNNTRVFTCKMHPFSPLWLCIVSQQVAVEASPAVASSWQFCSRVSWSITACSKFLTVCFYSSGWSYDVVGHETVCPAITNFFSSVNAALIWKYFLLPCHLLVSNHFCTMAQPGRLLLCSLKFDRPPSAFAI